LGYANYAGIGTGAGSHEIVKHREGVEVNLRYKKMWWTRVGAEPKYNHRMPRRKERQEPAGGAPFYRRPAGDPYRMVCDPTGHTTMTYGMWPLPGHTPYRSLSISYHPHIITALHAKELPAGFGLG
jgi:hypothetical protein